MTDQEMASLYDQGCSCTTIGLAADLSPHTVIARLRAAGVKLRASGGAQYDRTDLPADDVLAKAYQNGVSTNDLARKYATTRRTITRRLKRAGVEIGRYVPEPFQIKHDAGIDPLAPLKIPVEQVVQLYTGGESLRLTAKAAGVHERRVRKILADAGVKVRARGGARLSKSEKGFDLKISDLHGMKLPALLGPYAR